MAEEIDRIGTSPECATCRRTKAPLGGSVPLGMAGGMCNDDCPGYHSNPKPDQLWPGETAREFGYTYEPFVDWVICGGESGPGHREMDPEWARGVFDQCRAAGVPVFMKQSHGHKSGLRFADAYGADYADLDGAKEFPVPLKVKA